MIHIELHNHNPKYLSDVELELDKLEIDSDIKNIAKNADILILAITSAYVAKALITIKETLKEKIVISAIKGIVPETQQTIGKFLH